MGLSRFIARATLGLTRPNWVVTRKISFSARSTDLLEWEGDILTIGVNEQDVMKHNSVFKNLVLEKLDSRVAGLLSLSADEDNFTGKAGQSGIYSVTSLGCKRVSLVGIGQHASNAEYRKLGEMATAAAKFCNATSVAVAFASPVPPELKLSTAYAVATGTAFGAFEDVRFKRNEEQSALEKVDILGLGVGPEIENKLRFVEQLISGINFARLLANTRSSYEFGEGLLGEALDIVSQHKEVLHMNVHGRDQDASEYEASSDDDCSGHDDATLYCPPRFFHMRYTPPSGKVIIKLALVSRGLTDDICDEGSSEQMRIDMGSAAAVLGVAKAVAQIQPLGVEIHFIVAGCCGLTGGESLPAGRIVSFLNGKTVEVVNVGGGRGRIDIAGALIFACNQGMDKIVSMAALHDLRSVLGPAIMGFFSPSDALSEEVLRASKAVGERMHRMPLEEAYLTYLKSGVADLADFGDCPCTSMMGALFLGQFVRKKVMWAHLDMVGPVFNAKKNVPTGFGVMTMVEWIMNNSSN